MDKTRRLRYKLSQNDIKVNFEDFWGLESYKLKLFVENIWTPFIAFGGVNTETRGYIGFEESVEQPVGCYVGLKPFRWIVSSFDWTISSLFVSCQKPIVVFVV